MIATLVPSCTPCQIDRRKMSIATYQKRRIFVHAICTVHCICTCKIKKVPPPLLLVFTCQHFTIIVYHKLSLIYPSKIKKKVQFIGKSPYIKKISYFFRYIELVVTIIFKNSIIVDVYIYLIHSETCIHIKYDL